MSDEDILMRGGTEEDIAAYAHDEGACMYPKYPCDICESRGKPRVVMIKVKHSQDYVIGYNKGIADIRDYLVNMYESGIELDTEFIDRIVKETKIPKEEW